MYIISFNSFNDTWKWALLITEKETGLQELTEELTFSMLYHLAFQDSVVADRLFQPQDDTTWA